MSKRLEILELVERGEISGAEGVRRLEALVGTDPPEAEDDQSTASGTHAKSAAATSGGQSHTEAESRAVPQLGRIVSMVLLATGVALLCGGGLLVSAFYVWHIARAWMVTGWVLFAIGVLGTWTGWWLGRATWLSLRVHGGRHARVTLALPVPVGLIAWGVRMGRPWVPHLRSRGMDHALVALARELKGYQSIVVDVDERAHPEQVRISLG